MSRLQTIAKQLEANDNEDVFLCVQEQNGEIFCSSLVPQAPLCKNCALDTFGLFHTILDELCHDSLL